MSFRKGGQILRLMTLALGEAAELRHAAGQSFSVPEFLG
jgi:hypothetical protein